MDLKIKQAIAEFVQLREKHPSITILLRYLEDQADALSGIPQDREHTFLMHLGRMHGIRENCRKLRTIQPPNDDEPETPFTSHVDHPDLVNKPLK